MLFGYQVFRSYGARKFVRGVRVYKHLVPLGPKTSARKIYRLVCYANFRNRTLELYPEHLARAAEDAVIGYVQRAVRTDSDSTRGKE